MPVLAQSGRWGCAPARSSGEPALIRKANAVARVRPVGVRDRHAAAQLRVRRKDGVGLGVDPRDEERSDRCDVTDRFPRSDPAFEAGDVGVDHLLVAIDGEQQGHVDVDAASCRPRRLGCIRRTRTVATAARLVGGPQQIGGTTDVVERDREEELLPVAHARGGEGGELVVVELGVGDRLREDGRVRRRTCDRRLRDQLCEPPAREQVARERVEPDRDAGVMQSLKAIHVLLVRLAPGSLRIRNEIIGGRCSVFGRTS